MHWLSVHIASVHSEICQIIISLDPGPKVGWGTNSSGIPFCYGFFVLFFFPVTQESEELGGMS